MNGGKKKVSWKTVRRGLGNKGYVVARPALKPKLTTNQIKQRLVWCKFYKEMPQDFWEGVVFSDEIRVSIDRIDRAKRVKRPRGSRYGVRYVLNKEKYGGESISYWTYVTYYGVGPLHIIEGSMNLHQYCNILKEHAGEFQNLLLQDDNLSSHRGPFFRIL